MKERIKNYIELLQKGLLYLQSDEAYFKLSSPDEIKPELAEKCWDYPIDFYHLLSGIHFRNFDKDGVPIQLIDGDWVYSNSMIQAYGIAKVQEHLRTGTAPSLQEALVQGEYILNTADNTGKGLLLKAYEPGSAAHTGVASAMDQGQAACLFIRLYQLTGDKKWLEAAGKMFPAYEIEYVEGGVAYIISNDLIWLEEYPFKPLRHTLNGALFAVLGLSEYHQLTGELSGLKKKILDGLLYIMPQFDRKFWSNYHVSDTEGQKPYIASMKYHALHTIQLEIIGKLENNSELLTYSERFDQYQSSTFNRLRAMAIMVRSKVLKEYK